MSLRADSLKSNQSQKRAVAKEANAILAKMDDELKTAHEVGNHRVALTAPITFAIPYMSNANAQRMIYYKILTSLIERGFNPKIQLESDKTVFHVSWLTDDEEQEIDVQNTLLTKHMIKPEKK